MVVIYSVDLSYKWFYNYFMLRFAKLGKVSLKKKKVWNFFSMGEGTPLPESQNFLDILGKNLGIFYKFSRFISEK